MIRAAQPEPAIDLFAIFRRHFLKMFLVFSLAVGTAGAYTAFSPILYTSTAKVFVRLGRESVALDPTASTGQTMPVQESRENEINSVFELLKSREILESIVDDIGPDVILGKPGLIDEEGEGPISPWHELNPWASYGTRNKALKKLGKWYRVELVRKSHVISVGCDALTPELAQQIVEKAILQAKEIHFRVNRTSGSYDFFVAQFDRQGEQLVSQEDSLLDLKSKSGIAEAGVQRDIFQRRIALLEDEKLKTESALAAARAEAAIRKTTLQATPERLVASEITGQPATAASKMREQLYALELREKELTSKYKDEMPLVQQVRMQVAAARAVLDEEEDPTQVTTSLNSLHQITQQALLESEARAGALSAQVASLEGQLAAAREGLKTFHEQELAIVRLERQIDLEKGNFRKYAEQREVARIDRALVDQSISNLNILQPATRSSLPTKPRVLFNLAGGIALGLFGAVGIAVMAETASTPRQEFEDASPTVESPLALRATIVAPHPNGAGSPGTNPHPENHHE